jgi:hypothetical protein
MEYCICGGILFWTAIGFGPGIDPWFIAVPAMGGSMGWVVLPFVLAAGPSFLRDGMATRTMMNKIKTPTIAPIIAHKYGGNIAMKEVCTVK